MGERGISRDVGRPTQIQLTKESKPVLVTVPTVL